MLQEKNQFQLHTTGARRQSQLETMSNHCNKKRDGIQKKTRTVCIHGLDLLETEKHLRKVLTRVVGPVKALVLIRSSWCFDLDCCAYVTFHRDAHAAKACNIGKNKKRYQRLQKRLHGTHDEDLQYLFICPITIEELRSIVADMDMESCSSSAEDEVEQLFAMYKAELPQAPPVVQNKKRQSRYVPTINSPLQWLVNWQSK